MPALIMPDVLRAHGLETDITDDALELLIAAEEETIVERFGAHDAATDHFVGRSQLVLLRRRATAVSTVIEYDTDNVGVTLDASDYVLVHRGWALMRLATGPNPGQVFDRRVAITYTPVDDSAKRKHVLIQLVKLAVAYEGVKAAKDPDGSVTEHDYTHERNKIMRQLSQGPVFV